MDFGTIALMAMYEQYSRAIDTKLQSTMEQSLKRAMEVKKEKEKAIEHTMERRFKTRRSGETLIRWR